MAKMYYARAKCAFTSIDCSTYAVHERINATDGNFERFSPISKLTTLVSAERTSREESDRIFRSSSKELIPQTCSVNRWMISPRQVSRYFVIINWPNFESMVAKRNVVAAVIVDGSCRFCACLIKSDRAVLFARPIRFSGPRNRVSNSNSNSSWRDHDDARPGQSEF